MKKIIFSFICFTIWSCQTGQHAQRKEITVPTQVRLEGKLFATATLKPRAGFNAKGKAQFLKNNNGLQIVVSVTGATKGLHGIHIHEKGDCSAADFSSAGEHFNPTHLTHGSPDPMNYHIGDLGNIEINEGGSGVLSLVIPSSQYNAQFADYSKIIGKSLVLHDKRDDLVSQPSGDSGSRIACGVIKKH